VLSKKKSFTSAEQTWDIIDTHINHDSSGFYPRPLDELSFSNGSDDDIGIFNLYEMSRRKCGIIYVRTIASMSFVRL
jgi:hypothetical protein